jgi:hypothetical protein
MFNAALTVYKQDNINNLTFAHFMCDWSNAALTVYKQGNINNLTIVQALVLHDWFNAALTVYKQDKDK